MTREHANTIKNFGFNIVLACSKLSAYVFLYRFCADTTNSYSCLLQLRFLTILYSVLIKPICFIISTYIHSAGTVIP